MTHDIAQKTPLGLPKPVTPLKFQRTAIESMSRAVRRLADRKRRQSITLDAPTGSGKTTMIAELIKAVLAGKTVIFLTPGKGGLGDQSTLALSRQLLGSGIRVSPLTDETVNERRTAGQVFVGTYETLVMRHSGTKEYKNRITRFDGTGEDKTFWSWLREPGSEVVFIIDEAHYGKGTAKGAIRMFIEDMHEALGYFPLTIEASATPMFVYEKNDQDTDQETVTVSVRDAIDAGLLRKNIIVNNSKLSAARARFLPQLRANSTAIPVLLSAAVLQLDELDEALNAAGRSETAIAGVVVPDGAEGTAIIEAVEKHLREAHNITESNGQLMKYLSDEKSAELKSLDDPNCPVRFIIYKVALATGWDCPRAQVAVGFRSTKSKVLSRQNRGRYLRTVGGKHYDNDVLNQMYVFSNEPDFLEGIFDESAIGLSFSVELTAEVGLTEFVVPSVGKARGNQKPFKANVANALIQKHKASFLRALDYRTVSLDRNQAMLSGSLDTAKYLEKADDATLERSTTILSTAPTTLRLQNEVQGYIENPVGAEGLDFGNNGAAAEAITYALLRAMRKEPEFQAAHSRHGSMTPNDYLLALLTSDVLKASGKERNQQNVDAVRALVWAVVTDPAAPKARNSEHKDIVSLDDYSLKYTGLWSPGDTRHVRPNEAAKLTSAQLRGRRFQPMLDEDGGKTAYALVPLTGPEQSFESTFISDAVLNGFIEWFEHNGDDPADFSVAAEVDGKIVVCRPDYIGVACRDGQKFPFYFEVKDSEPSSADRLKGECVFKNTEYTGVLGAVVYEPYGRGTGWYVLRNNSEQPEALEDFIARYVYRPLPEGLGGDFSTQGVTGNGSEAFLAALK